MTTIDPRARRRLDMGLALMGEGAAGEAVEAMRAAVDAAPEWADAHFSLARALDAAGEAGQAAASYRDCLALEPADRLGAAPHLARLEGRALRALPRAYVRTLFDQYAPRFDAAMAGPLAYRAPRLLRAAVEAEIGPGRGGLAILDLGCGTGLAGLAFRDLAARLEGVDLSPAMIAQARRRGVYDRLEEADVVEALLASGSRFDLVLAADVLVYLGDLQPVLVAAAARLAPGGLIAFTLERSGEPGFALGERQRFAHHPGHVAAAAEAARLAVARLEEVSVRTENARPVPGLLAVLRAEA
jgi:predicted TPR repeat methyltransferase